MTHSEILEKASSIFVDRGKEYGAIEQNFDRISKIASVLISRPLRPWEIAMVLHALKLARIVENPDHEDSYVDGVNYLVIAAHLRGIE